jgi:hypothetical protein
VDMVRSFSSNFGIPKSLKSETPKMKVYLNRVPTKVVPKTPFELFKGWKPSLCHIRVRGFSPEVIVCKYTRKETRPWNEKWVFHWICRKI